MLLGENVETSEHCGCGGGCAGRIAHCVIPEEVMVGLSLSCKRPSGTRFISDIMFVIFYILVFQEYKDPQ